ncbi:MAG: LLM class F420-dependent oxidoreductase [Candidatus Thorarchaeota archaeon]|jgi:F420-dependent oxidoreductase-like protein
MKVKFGVHIEPQLGFDYNTAEVIALEAEKLGYESFWCSDHLFLNDKSEEQNCMDAWTLLAALASKTEKIRLGTLVTCNSYRHPSLIAKVAATIDMISNGRLWFGYGAGWKKVEYDAYGYPFPPIGERMDKMEEALQIIKMLWTEPKASFDGKYYSIKDAFAAPKPIQKPMPPILVGGDGEKRTLKIVAKYADYCNLFMRPELEHKLSVLKSHCKDFGRDYEDVGKSLFAQSWPGVFVSDSEEIIIAELSRRAENSEKSIEDLKKHYRKDAPGSWVGFPEEVRERFEYLVSLGFDFFQVMFPGIGEDYVKASRAFAKHVISKV